MLVQFGAETVDESHRANVQGRFICLGRAPAAYVRGGVGCRAWAWVWLARILFRYGKHEARTVASSGFEWGDEGLV